MGISAAATSRPTWPIAVGLTALAFAALHWAGLLGSLPLPEVLGILALCVLAIQWVTWRYGPFPERAGVILTVHVVCVTVVIYVIGWGPTLALGYVFPLGEHFRTRSSKGWPLAFALSLIGMACGQLAIAFGVVHSYVPSPYVHVLAGLAALGLAFVMHLLATTASSRETAEGEARRSEHRFRSLVRNAGDVVMVLGDEGTHLYDSPAVERVLGYKPEDLQGDCWVDAFHPDDADVVAEIRSALRYRPHEPYRAELRVRHADGTWLWCELWLRNLFDDPAVGGVVVNLSDVTERHRRLEIQRRLAAIVESSEDAIIGIGLDRRITSWNAAAEAMYGYSAEEVVGREILPQPGEEPMICEIMGRIVNGERIDEFETTRRRKEGAELDLSVTVSPICDGYGNVTGASVIARDITEKRRAAKALRESEASFRQMFSANPQPMWVCDQLTSDILEVNDAAIDRYGYTRETFLGMKFHQIMASPELNTRREDSRRAPEAFERSGPSRHRLSDGALIDVEVTSHGLVFGGREAVLVGAKDVTEQNIMERRLRHQAFHDELTGVANRALLRDRIDQALARARRTGSTLAVVVVDLDHFHQINDVFGPDMGDRVLKEVANALGELVRPTDTVARIGSDEFAMLLADLKEAVNTAAAVADRVLERLAAPVALEGNQISIEATIGAAVATDTTLEVAELIQRAETALARAKHSLLRREIADPSQTRSSAQRVAVVAELRQAIENGRLRLHYQPVVDLHDRRVASLEALVRWEHPERGLVPPDDFVPLAERTGLIRPLTAFVLRQAIHQLADWRAIHPELAVSVNLGTANLTDPDLARDIAQLLFENGIPPRALTLEITEGGVMAEPSRTAEVVSQLSDLGVGLSVDDFGSGYSSLSKLRSLPISEIKLDKSFVMNMSSDPSDATIVRSSIELAHNLGVRVVAEGIEDAAVAEDLERLSCDFGQGYWLCKPMPASAMRSWLNAVSRTTIGSPWDDAVNLSAGT